MSLNTTVPKSQQRNALLALSHECSNSAENISIAADSTGDFELRAFLTNCSCLRNSIADEFFVAASKLQTSESVPLEDESVTQNRWAANTFTDDASILAACRKSEESLAGTMRQALQMPLSPEPDAVVRKYFAEVVATTERIKSLEQSL
jgi:hypothetical protein